MPHLPHHLHLSPGQVGAVAFGVAAAVGVGLYTYLHRSPDPEEIERLRRHFLATEGRITDATLIDTTLTQPDRLPPSGTLQYQYRVAGVIYESSQDVSALVENLSQLRVDLPIQVRYDPHNPGNSIVAAESWNGLRIETSDSGDANEGPA